MVTISDVWLRRGEAARILGRSPKTLRDWEAAGKGPPVHRDPHGSQEGRYRLADLLRSNPRGVETTPTRGGDADADAADAA